MQSRGAGDPQRIGEAESLRSTPPQRANQSANVALGASNELQIGAGLARWAAREASPASAAITKGTGGSAAAGCTPIARDRRGASTAMVRAQAGAASEVSRSISTC